MQNARLDEAQTGIKIAKRNINNLRYADETSLMAETEEELKSLLMKVKEENEKAGLKLNIPKMKIVASGMDHKEAWAPKNRCFQSVLEKTFERPLDSKEIRPVNPKGSQPLIFIGRTDAGAEAPVLLPPDTKSWFIGKDPEAGKDWGQEEKRATEDEMVR